MNLSSPEPIRSLMDDLRSISHDDSLAWTEWTEKGEEGDPAIPVRIQLVDNDLSFHWGDVQFDTDSRGHWGYGYVYQDMREEDLRELAIALIDDLEEDQAI